VSDPTVDAPHDEGSRRSRSWSLFTGRRRRWVIGIVLINLLGVLALAGIGSAKVAQCGGGFSGYSGGGGGGCSADIIVRPYTAPTPAHVGQRLIYLITIRNYGPDGAGGIQLTIRLPKGVQVNWWMSSSGQYGGGCDYQNRVVDCFFYEGIQRGGSVAATVVIVPIVKGTISTSVSAQSGTHDPHPKNNTVTIKTVVGN
jgi:uncharacterized repeat protein (TIGR01451 family)